MSTLTLLKCAEAGWSGLIRSTDTAEPTAINTQVEPTSKDVDSVTLSDFHLLLINTNK